MLNNVLNAKSNAKTQMGAPNWQILADKKAENATRKRISKALRQSTPTAFEDFYASHQRDIEKWLKRSAVRFFINPARVMHTYKTSASRFERTHALNRLRALTQDYIRENKIHPDWLKRLKIEPVTKEHFAKKLKHKAERTYQGHSVKHQLRQSLSAYVAHKIPNPLIRMALPHALKQLAIPAALLAGLSAPVFEHPDFTAQQHTQSLSQIFAQSCNSADIMTASLIHTKQQNISQNANAASMMLASMQGLEYNISPLALHMVGNAESAQGERVATRASSAKGEFQILNGTAIDWLARHHQTMPYFTELRERLESGQSTRPAEDELELSAVTQAIATYNADREGTVRKIHNSNIDSSMHTALELARRPVIAGQLVAAQMASVTNDLFIHNLPYDPEAAFAQIQRGVAAYYFNHFLGETGVKNMNLLISHAPNIDIRNPNNIATALSAQGYSGNFIANLTNNIQNTLRSNEGLYPQGALTAQQFKDSIHNYAIRKTETYRSSIMQAAKSGLSPAQMCGININDTPQIIPTNISIIGLLEYRTDMSMPEIGAHLIHTATSYAELHSPHTPQTGTQQTSTQQIHDNIPRPVPRPPHLGQGTDAIGQLLKNL